MGIDYHWDEEQPNILVMSFDHDWTSGHFHDAMHRLTKLAFQHRQPFHMIVDAQQMRLYSSAMMLDLAQSGVQRMPPNCGCCVVVTRSPLLETVVRTASALYPSLNHRLYPAPNFTSAYKIIERYQQRQDRQRESLSAD